MKCLNKKGFTIVEILSVIAIIGIMILIVVPSTFLIVKNINNRVYESKKNLILSAAEVYAQDRKALFNSLGTNKTEIEVPIKDLLVGGYLKADDKCKSGQIEEDCIVDPRDKSNMNDKKVLVRYLNNSYIAIWEGKTGSTKSGDLLDIICKDLAAKKAAGFDCDCTTIDEANPYCLYKGTEVNNWLKNGDVEWRVLGVYKDGNDDTLDNNGWPNYLKVKIITQDNI
ncbi:MAG: prepilin-type N-terminal cleavage/methylation domain-containing protein [Bacilli bacterium]